MNIAENAAIDDGKVIGIFSLEMSSEALIQRLLCSRSLVDSHKFRTGSLWQEDIKKVARAMEELANAPLFIDDTPGISISEMRAKARRLKQAQGRLDLIVVDYLQLMSGGGKRFENRTQEVSAISDGWIEILAADRPDVSRVRQRERPRKPRASRRGGRLRVGGGDLGHDRDHRQRGRQVVARDDGSRARSSRMPTS